MSRRPRLLLAALLLSSPLAAQEAAGDAVPSAPTVTAEQAIATAQDAYGPPDTRAKPACPTPRPGDEIVVCAQTEDNSKYRVQSSGDLDPAGAGAKDGVPRAPDVGTVYPGVVVATGCFVGPCPPPMPVLIDLKAIPEAPPGSDADRVGQGLAPRSGSGTPPAALTPPGSASPAEEPLG